MGQTTYIFAFPNHFTLDTLYSDFLVIYTKCMCVVLEIMSVIFRGSHYYMIYKTNGSLKGECTDGYVFSNIIKKGCAGDVVVPLSLMFHVFCQNTITAFELTFRLRVKSCCLYFLNLHTLNILLRKFAHLSVSTVAGIPYFRFNSATNSRDTVSASC